MYIAAIVLFLIPTVLITVAWNRGNKIQPDMPVPRWRFYCLISSLTLTTLAIPIGFGESCAWLYAGGDPHGMGTPAGLWVPLCRLFRYAILVCVLLGLLGKGKGRFVGISAAIAAFVSNTMVVLLDFE